MKAKISLPDLFTLFFPHVLHSQSLPQLLIILHPLVLCCQFRLRGSGSILISVLGHHVLDEVTEVLSFLGEENNYFNVTFKVENNLRILQIEGEAQVEESRQRISQVHVVQDPLSFSQELKVVVPEIQKKSKSSAPN